jgi:hypothetical protein
MPNRTNHNRPHFSLLNTATSQAFKARTVNGRPTPLPERDRQQHGAALQSQLLALRPAAARAANQQQQSGLTSGLGLQIEFVGWPDVALAFGSLHEQRQKIELLSVRTEGAVTYATVFVPDGKLAHFEKYIKEYLAERKNKNGDSLDHKALINTIAMIRLASIRALWTDDVDQLPEDQTYCFWWEVWLPVRGNRGAVLADFHILAKRAGCEVSPRQANFPERTVVWMYGSQQQLQTSVAMLNCVAELRRAKDTAEFFDGLPPAEQQGWVESALERLHIPADNDIVPRICLIDSGINRGHPMLAPFISSADLYTYNPAWGVNDAANHGTGLAGLALFGDMTNVLANNGPITIAHRLESVKIILDAGTNTNGGHSHAALFGDAVSQPEITAPNRPRLFATAVTASDYRDRGRPSSWSSMVDRLACDADAGDDDNKFPRLFVLAAGNIRDGNAWMRYPASLSTNLIHDPGQAWNAITVGAFTGKFDTEELALAPVASDGGLSPFTTTSAAWESAWPLKPDVVMEGGNVSKNSSGFAGMQPSLSLLTTNNQPLDRLLTTTNATSAAAALCARLAAQTQNKQRLICMQ